MVGQDRPQQAPQRGNLGDITPVAAEKVVQISTPKESDAAIVR